MHADEERESERQNKISYLWILQTAKGVWLGLVRLFHQFQHRFLDLLRRFSLGLLG